MSIGYTVRRLIQSVFVVWGVVTIVFFLLRVQGDPVRLLLPYGADQQEIALLRRAYGLDRPLYIQYERFLAKAVQGDFGTSIQFHQSALLLVLGRMPATIELGVASMAVALVAGVPLGIFSAIRRNSVLDRLAMVGALLGQSTPTFFTGILMILIFAVQLHLLPTSGRTGFKSLILPALTLGFFSTAQITRLVRSGMLEVIGLDYVRTARAKGIVELQVILRHALPNALIAVVTVVGLEFGNLLGGAVITETVFAWPGVGRLAVQAVSSLDYPLVQADVVLFACIIITANFLVDVTYPLLDPRVKFK